MNNCAFIGRFIADPELKQTPAGLSVCTFTLAIDRPNAKDMTDFINFVAWREKSEFIARYFKKGNKIAITGTLTSRKYQDTAGAFHKTFEVLVDRAEFCESKEKTISAPTSEDMKNAYAPAYQQVQAQFEEIQGGDDLPF